jgi:hypothetical protein
MLYDALDRLRRRYLEQVLPNVNGEFNDHARSHLFDICTTLLYSRRDLEKYVYGSPLCIIARDIKQCFDEDIYPSKSDLERFGVILAQTELSVQTEKRL